MPKPVKYREVNTTKSGRKTGAKKIAKPNTTRMTWKDVSTSGARPSSLSPNKRTGYATWTNVPNRSARKSSSSSSARSGVKRSTKRRTK